MWGQTERKFGDILNFLSSGERVHSLDTKERKYNLWSSSHVGWSEAQKIAATRKGLFKHVLTLGINSDKTNWSLCVLWSSDYPHITQARSNLTSHCHFLTPSWIKCKDSFNSCPQKHKELSSERCMQKYGFCICYRKSKEIISPSL